MGRLESEKKTSSNGGKCLILPCFAYRVSSSPPIEDDGKSIVRYSYKALASATQGFQASYKIGEGGFGSVYKGKLGNGLYVAVKVLSAKSIQGEREFMAEIDSMRNARHENLIRLRGYCIEGWNRALVYEYMERNSLAQTLLSGRRCNINFNWAVRKRIALGIARGLTFLHEVVRPHIVHRDIKPSNILLDSDLNPKISDFGLAKLFPDNITHISTRVAGTIGYLAPEYARCGKLTRKSDVYSYGVLLLEIINGRSATNYALGIEEYNIVEKAWEMYNNDRVLQLTDPSILEDSSKQEVNRFLKVALLCVQEMPNKRPTMSRVVEMLANEIDTSTLQISRPGLISDLQLLKIGQTPAIRHTPSGNPPTGSTSSSLNSTGSSI